MDKKEQAVERAEAFLNGLIEKMHLNCQVERTIEDDRVRLKVVGEDNSALIGYRGEELDAIQYLTLIVANRDNGDDFVNVAVDTEGYREKRTKTLTDLALRLADKADRTGRRVKLEPMNPFERRIIHSALQDSDKATTVSEGEGDRRHVVIIPKNEKKQSEAYDPYAPAEGYALKPVEAVDFKKKGFGKMRSFGYKRSER